MTPAPTRGARKRRVPEVSLMRRFVLVGVLVTVTTASISAYTVTRHLVNQELERAARRAAMTAELLITPKVTARDFATPTPDSVERWHARLADALASTDIVRVKVFSASGTVVYSDDPTIIGQQYQSPPLNAALAGRLSREVGKPRKTDNAGEQQYSQLFEVYAPVREAGSRRIIGVYEMYRDFTRIRPQLVQLQAAVWSGFLTAFGLLFASLYALVRGASRRLEFMAYHDPLTGLANRYQLTDCVARAMSGRQDDEEPLALLSFDLARFKAVNDSWGHQTGDAVLQQVASRVRSLVGGNDTVARLGADEFVVLLGTPASRQHATDTALRIIGALEAPFTIHGQQVSLSTRVGIARYPHDAQTPEELLVRADAAMHRAKADGTRFEFYQPHMVRYTREQLQFEEDLRHALRQEDLQLHYQPLVNMQSGRVIGAEALVRWVDAKRGVIPPLSFIPLAEQNGMIRDIDRYVVTRALRQLAAWHARGTTLTMAVNLSPQSFADSTFAPWLAEQLTTADVPAGHLTLEITERVLMDAHTGRQRVEALAALGVQIALDDFGTGYSSLAYLQALPIGQLKIDRHFVQGIGTVENSDAIVRTIISLAHNMGIESIAEGIETQDHYDWLTREGCHAGQGYLTGKPMPAPEFTQLLETHHAGAPTGAQVR